VGSLFANTSARDYFYTKVLLIDCCTVENCDSICLKCLWTRGLARPSIL